MVTAKELTTIPAIYQKVEEYQQGDTRFVKMRIWLMHTGLNLNGSFFTKEVVEKAIPTLANTHVVAYMEENSKGENDFSDHRMVLHRSEDGELKVKYLGVAIGTIPETNNAHWEKRVADDGIEREYLVVDALIWTKWEDTIDILKSKKGIVSQSMELSNEYSGYFDNDGLFHFESFQFNGACLLGEDYRPAMEGSTGEVTFNTDIHKNIENKLQEFYTLFSKENSQEGGNEVEQENLNTEEQVEETVDQETEAPENTEVETTTEAPAENQQEQEEETQEEAATEAPEQTEAPKADQEFINEDVEVETETEEVETETEDAPNFEQMYNDLQVEFEQLQNEVKTLKDFKRTSEQKTIRDKFQGRVTEEEFTQVFEQFKDADTQTIEKELFSIIGMRNFSIQTTQAEETNRMQIPAYTENDEQPYGGLLNGFEKN